jgi:RimK family alpha-L-glutamate ligase
MRANRTVAIFSDDPDWHARRLTAALAARGVDSVCVSLAECSFDIAGGGGGLTIPGFADAPPDGALVRLISAGTLEQLTLRLSLLHALGELGVPVSNDARALERTVDKSMTSFLLHRAGLSTPPTWAAESPELAQLILKREIAAGEKLVLKPLFGSQGKGLRLLRCTSDLPAPEEVGGVYYLQRYVDTGAAGWHDWRVLVVGGRPVAAMIRRGRRWVTNVLQGAECEGVSFDGEPGELATAAVGAVGASYAGVDLIRDQDGRFLVLEVNSVPAWKGLQGVTDVDIAQTIVDDLLRRLAPADARAAAL